MFSFNDVTFSEVEKETKKLSIKNLHFIAEFLQTFQ